MGGIYETDTCLNAYIPSVLMQQPRRFFSATYAPLPVPFLRLAWCTVESVEASHQRAASEDVFFFLVEEKRKDDFYGYMQMTTRKAEVCYYSENVDGFAMFEHKGVVHY